MRKLIAAAVVAFACQPAFAVETFDQAWAKRWRPQVTGSLLSRRFEPEIKASAKEVWDVAQQNVTVPIPIAEVRAAEEDHGYEEKVRDWCEKTKSKLTVGKGNKEDDWSVWRIEFQEGHVLEVRDEFRVSRFKGTGVYLDANDPAWWAYKELYRTLTQGTLIEGKPGYWPLPNTNRRTAPAGPLVAANKAAVKVKAKAARGAPIRRLRRRGLFR